MMNKSDVYLMGGCYTMVALEVRFHPFNISLTFLEIVRWTIMRCPNRFATEKSASFDIILEE